MKNWKTIGLMAVLSAVLITALPLDAHANYESFTVTPDGKPRLTQTAYRPVGELIGAAPSVASVAGRKAGAGGEAAADEVETAQPALELNQPEDLFIAANDHLYIADAGNGRVVELDPEGRLVREYGAGELTEPTGVYAAADGAVYVADYGAEEIAVYDSTGKRISSIGRPDSLLFGKSASFKPRKLTLDKRNNLYIAGEGLTQGLAELRPDGAFLGYFGSNPVPFSLERTLQRLFFTRKQLEQLSRKLPPSPSNVAVGEDGLLFTATVGLAGGSLKKLNVAGDNLLRSAAFMSPNIADLAVDRSGNLFAVDGVAGTVYVYDKDGNLLFAFGGTDTGYQTLGYFTAPSGIAVNSRGFVYVLDRERGNVQMFQPTPFAGLVLKATDLYLNGRYSASMEPWKQVLRLDGMFDLAHLGMGLAYYKQGDYDLAFEELKTAGNVREYSNTFWELRRDWIMRNLSTGIVLLLASVVLLKTCGWLHRRHGFFARPADRWRRLLKRRLPSQLLHGLRVMRHPIDGFYELTEDKASVLSASLLLLWLGFVRLVEVYGTGFIFGGRDPSRVNLSAELLKLLVPLFAWIVVNYLISVIHDGEGRFRDVYKGTIYALSPYLLLGIPLVLLSRGLTLMEAVIYDYSRLFIIGWCILLLFLMVKEIHGYEINETFKNIAITLSGMAIAAVVSLVLFGLSSQVWDFMIGIVQEVKYLG